MANPKKQPAKAGKKLFEAHSPGLQSLAADARAKVRDSARKAWHQANKTNETH